MKKKILIFDMDGVLFNSSAIAYKYMLEQFPDMTEEMSKEILVGNFHEEVAKITLARKIETDEEKKSRKLKYSKAKSEVPMYDGAKELLNDLKKEGYILALNTSAVDYNCVPLLENQGIKDIFEFLGTSDISKSKVEKFKIIEEKYKASKENMLFVTDTLGDIREADIANIPTVAVTWGAHDKSYFNREPHNNLVGIVDSINELRIFIEKF